MIERVLLIELFYEVVAMDIHSFLRTAATLCRPFATGITCHWHQSRQPPGSLEEKHYAGRQDGTKQL
jgi:hypothetical protein